MVSLMLTRVQAKKTFLMFSFKSLNSHTLLSKENWWVLGDHDEIK